ncbi:MAG: type I 3-dehydroquinate dehydratase [Planctomycetota bacterium]|nr:type I 3-dehydroquinate dehydratase [Planctomycetota bacterium]
MTRIAVAIMVHSLEQGLAAAARAAEHGADLVEFRVDQFADPANLPQIVELVERSALPCILTCRPTWEGGLYDGDDQTRISLLEHIGLAKRPPAYIDVEFVAYQRSANLRQKVGLVVDHPEQVRPVSTGLILSSHDFDRRPTDLLQRVEAMASAPACRVMKIVWKARSLRDNLEAFELLAAKHKPTIALCMGEEGLASRVLAKKFGALLTFAALDAQSGTAPGQPAVAQLKGLYRWDRIGPATKVYGVIGHPVGHSMSPAIHNAGFDAVENGFDGVYLPLPIPPEYEHFKATVGAWLDEPGLHFRGASVTIPHKENLLRFAREWAPAGKEPAANTIEPLAELIGAANTLSVRDDGSLFVCNTDYAAALDAVCAGLGIGRPGLAGRRVAVIGAGGAARAIVAGFAQHGASVVVYNRTIEKAQALAERFAGLPGKVVAAAMEKLCDSCCEVFINCTPVGMHPKVDQTPVPAELRPGNKPGAKADGKVGWGPQTLVFDTIYNPVQTQLLRDAREAGCKTITGVEMFVRQAAAQFELWTGKKAPVEVFRGVLAKKLGGG